MQSYNLEYLNEVMFKKIEKFLEKYHSYTYENLVFNIFPALMEGDFKGKIVSCDTKRKITKYELKLPIVSNSVSFDEDDDFTLHYMVYENKKTVILDKITRSYQKIKLKSYKGVEVPKNRMEQVYKVNLLDSFNPITTTFELRTLSRDKSVENIKNSNNVNKKKKKFIFELVIFVLIFCALFCCLYIYFYFLGSVKSGVE